MQDQRKRKEDCKIEAGTFAWLLATTSAQTC